MDPDANLAEQHAIAMTILSDAAEEYDHCEPHFRLGGESLRLAELVIALHEWIQKGGALPKAWNRSEVVK